MRAIEPTSQTFVAVRERCEELINVARAQIERAGLPLDITEYQRGRISALREIISMGEASPIDASKDVVHQPRMGDRSGI